jgi:hypothetical protein
VLNKLILWMLLWESAVFRNLYLAYFTSKPCGFKKNYLCIYALANIFRAILGMKVVIIISVKIIMRKLSR